MAYLKEYLKVCWRLLYKADMLRKECGVERKWDAKIVRALQRWGFEGKYGEEMWANNNVEERNGQWVEGIPNDFGSMQRDAGYTAPELDSGQSTVSLPYPPFRLIAQRLHQYLRTTHKLFLPVHVCGGDMWQVCKAQCRAISQRVTVPVPVAG